jgi:ABC-2 type transport system permease protein
VFWNFVKCELRLDLKRLVGYRVSFISDLVIFASIIVTTFLSGLDRAFANAFDTSDMTGKMLVLIGFICWQIASTGLGWSANNIRGQMTSGTFELKMQSQFPVELMLFIEMLTYLLVSFISLTCFFIIFLLIIGGGILQIVYIPLTYLVAFPGVLGMFGIGLILGGVSLREKNIGNLVFILQTAMIFVSDFIDVRRRGFNIIPFNAAIKIMRSVYLSRPVHYTHILDYLLVNIAWVLIGIFVFRSFLATERKKGAFDTY